MIASLVQRKPAVLRPGFAGMRGLWSYDHGTQDHDYPPFPCVCSDESVPTAVLFVRGFTCSYTSRNTGQGTVYPVPRPVSSDWGVVRFRMRAMPTLFYAALAVPHRRT